MIQAMRAGEELCTVLGEDALASECRAVASKAIEFSLRKNPGSLRRRSDYARGQTGRRFDGSGGYHGC